MNKGWMVAFAIGAGLLFLIVLPPFVGESVRGYVMQVFQAVCHQLPGRSPHVDGVQLAVCHRCLGIYVGLPIASLIYLSLRGRTLARGTAPIILALSLVPMIFDWGGDVVGLFTNTPGTRIATGLVFGLVAGYLLTTSVADTFTKRSEASTEPEANVDT